MAVAEGTSISAIDSSNRYLMCFRIGAVYVAYVTFDGGATWKETFNASGDVPDTMVSSVQTLKLAFSN